MPTELSEDDAIVALDDYTVDVGGELKVEVTGANRRRTVNPREVYSFERDLLDNLIESSMSGSVTGAAIPVKGKWIYGWLDEKGEDYINSIWKGYQYFLKYVEAETAKIGNIGKHSRSPGSYDTMYRYILVLEDLGLLERYRRENVAPSEYDFNVPEEFRTRTYVKLTAPLEGNEGLWNDPVGSRYVDGDEDTGKEPVFDNKPEAPSSTIDEFIESADKQEDVDIDEQVSTGPYTFSRSEVRIDEFEDYQLIPVFVDNNFNEAVEEAFEQAAMIPPDLEPSDIELGRVSAVGPWGSGTASPEETQINLYIEIINASDSMNAGFIPGGINRTLPDMLNKSNIFEEAIPSYDIQSSYSTSYTNQLRSYIQRKDFDSEYYDITNDKVSSV